MARPDRIQAVQLRRMGTSYNEIHRLLGVPKSTLSSWFRDVRLSDTQRKLLMDGAQRIWAENLIRYNQKRSVEAKRRAADVIAIASAEIGRLTRRELLLIGSALYWAEGGKFDRWRLHFSNTDPSMVRLMMRFFREVCEVRSENLSAQIHLHPNTTDSRAKQFWSLVTGIPVQRFIRSQISISRSSKGRRPPSRLPYGTLHIYVCRADIRNKTMGWISGLSGSSDKNQHYSLRV